MLGEKLEKQINDQINKELYSAYLYLAMAAQFEAENLPGFASWMKKQAEEEQEHAMKFFGYVNERGGRVVLEAIEKPATDFGTPVEVFTETLAHEQKVTALINSLYETALEEKDYASQSFLQWFIDEQVEEEDTASGILETLKMIGDKGHALIMFDHQLGQR
jgi:ferritin